MSDCIVFDFDFTIAKTSENIWVWSPRGCNIHNYRRYYTIHPQELSSIGIGDDEQLDNESFIEFYDINLTKTKVIQPIIINMIYYTNFLNTTVNIVTARPQCVENKVLDILNNNKIDTKNIQFNGLKNSQPKAKIDFIKTLLSNDTDKLVIYEDSLSVIELAKEYFKDIVSIECVYIKHLNNKTILNYI